MGTMTTRVLVEVGRVVELGLDVYVCVGMDVELGSGSNVGVCVGVNV